MANRTHRKNWPDDYLPEDEKALGIGCPKCGCRRADCSHTIPKEDNTRQRRKVCANCGRVYYTYESLKHP